MLPDLSSALPGALRLVVGPPSLVAGDPRCFQACRQRSQTCCRRCQVLPGAPNVLSGSPRCSQTYHKHFHGTPVPVIRDRSYSEGWQEFPPRVWYSPEIDASKFTLNILSDTSGGFQWLKYILLMEQSQYLHTQSVVNFSWISSQRYWEERDTRGLQSHGLMVTGADYKNWMYYMFQICHGSGVMNDHSMMLSCGDCLRFINNQLALSPHQWPPSINPLTSSSPPTLKCCHSCNGVIIQCKYTPLYSLRIKIKNDASHGHHYMR